MRANRQSPPNRTPEELGQLIARAHFQAWRSDAPPFDLTVEELAAILPNLIKSGSAGMVWHRVKPVRERYGALAMALEAATEAQIAHNQRVEVAVAEVVTRLRAHGIEPVLVKGLALAKLYPEGIIRPAGDIDLVVRKHEFAAAHAIIHDRSRERIPIDVDLKHPGIWEEAPNEDFWSRTTSMPVLDQSIAVLAPADNLLMVCFHFLKHGGLRPLWLCDFGLTYESSITQVVMERQSPTHQSWLNALAATTVQLVGTCARPEVGEAPSWLIENIRGQWLNPRDVVRQGALSQLLANPLAIADILAEAWPTPIAATFWQHSTIESTFSSQLLWQEYGRRFRDHLHYRMMHQLGRSRTQSR